MVNNIIKNVIFNRGLIFIKIKDHNPIIKAVDKNAKNTIWKSKPFSINNDVTITMAE